MASEAYGLSVVVPTRNERASIEALLAALGEVAGVSGLALEVIVVDDSDDGTVDVAEAAAGLLGSRGRVVAIHRDGAERAGGLGTAVIRGLREATEPFVVVMDGDLQHPPAAIPRLLDVQAGSDADLVVASRYVDGGRSAGGFGRARAAISRGCTSVGRRALGVAEIGDPLSGFFLVRRDALELDQLKPLGFKVLIDIIARHPDLRVAEAPFEFGSRYGGQSKASVREGLNYARTVARLYRHRPAPRHHYDIHGIIGVSSDARLPELEAFRVDRVSAPDIQVRVVDASTDRPGAFRYREIFGARGFAVDIDRTDGFDVRVSGALARSPHVLYTNVVEPLLRWSLVERDLALVHAACIARDGSGILITARTDTGKTTTMLKLLDADSRWSFLSDDLVIIRSDGTLLTYPKPLTISAHTVHALPRAALTRRERLRLSYQSRIHSRLGRRVGFALDMPGIPVATANALLQIAVPPPKYAVTRLVPTTTVATKADLTGLVVIARGGSDERTLDPDEALSTLLANCEDAYGFPPYPTLVAFLLEGEYAYLRQRERDIIGAALEGAPAKLLESTTLDWATRIPTVVDEWDQEYVERVVIDLRASAPVVDVDIDARELA